MKTEVSDFWVGTFASEKDFFDFFAENEGYYGEDDTEPDQKFLSEFARSQGENRIDHDVMECGFENDISSLNQSFKKYSYSSQWLPEVITRTNKMNLKINTIAFVTKGRVKKPGNVKGNSFSLVYIGQVEYKI